MNPYSTTAWRKFRAEFLEIHPRCVCTYCPRHVGRKCNRIANTVDHITPARSGGYTRFQAMCTSCHSTKTATFDGGWGHSA